jgi:hypothetical protein
MALSYKSNKTAFFDFIILIVKHRQKLLQYKFIINSKASLLFHFEMSFIRKPFS